ncbi:ABC-2 type transport system permease protein [Actinocorallia herbida]|uniref:ABC-2 type transport system permease protein n=1 Tax=Actinocorallia herbida TaxID=58109 RepID=A0A3N1DCB8_9ACTN|nr:ABC transporter permease [Actinocorallia herbida]ROO91162.1 ABC-2 type transport system permease protein [Actinocorallia herbida]
MSTAIHDIGYRHYDGPRQSHAQTVRALYVHNLRTLFGFGRGAKAKIIPFALLAMLMLPALADIVVKAVVKEAEFIVPLQAYGYGFQPLIAIFLAAQAPVAASREIRYRVVPLYFSRPVGPRDFVLAKFGAFTTALLLLTALPMTLMYVGYLFTRPGIVDAASQEGSFRDAADIATVAEATGQWALALVGALLLALVLSSFALLVAAFTPRRGFGVAAVIALYLMSNAIVGIVQGIADTRGAYELAGWMNLFTPVKLVYGTQVSLFGAAEAPIIYSPPDGAGVVFLLFCVLIVAGSLAALHARFRKAGA